MLCPHKVTKSQCHLGEKNNQHTPKIFMGYCTGTAAFRDLFSSTLAQSSVLNTNPSAPSLLCIPALKRMGHCHPKTDIVLTYTGVSEWKLLETENCRRQQKKEAMNLAPPPSGMQLPLSTSTSRKESWTFMAFLLVQSTHTAALQRLQHRTGKRRSMSASQKDTYSSAAPAHHSLAVYTHTRIIRAVTVN